VGGSVLGFVVVVDALALAWPSPTSTNGAQVVGCAKGSPFEIRDTMERRRASALPMCGSVRRAATVFVISSTVASESTAQ
jgi:hypothetical protein